MLPKAHRLKKEKDFQEVMKQGRTVSKAFLILKFRKNDLAVTRIGFVVSQKISKRATIRNRVKRRLKGLARSSLPRLRSGYDLIFFTKKGIEEKNFREVEIAAKSLLEKAGLLIGKS